LANSYSHIHYILGAITYLWIGVDTWNMHI
jgi:hypothetical protein